MPSTPTTKSELLKSHQAELVKQYITYDISNRMEYVYTAKDSAVEGDSCIKTQYVYDGSTTRITKRKESYAVWDSDYDIA